MINLKTNDWKIKNIDTVLFDKDGTFIDLHYFWGKMTELRINAVIKKYSLDNKFFRELCLSLGYDILTQKMLKNGITALYSRPKIIELFKNDLSHHNIQATEEEIEHIFNDVSKQFYSQMNKYTKPINSAIEFIKKLNAKGVKCGIVTSDSIESTNLTIKHFQWEDLFQVVIGRESTIEDKESGVGTKKALQFLNSNQRTTVMIGDAPMDYIAAKNASIENVILVSTGQIEKEELSKISPYTVESLEYVTIY